MTVTVTTRGVWKSVSVDLPKLSLNDDKVRWGVPNEPGIDQQSGYDFEGTVGDAPLDGKTDFILGTFTHHNYTLTDLPHYQFWVNLDVYVEFGVSGDTFEHYFPLHFRHYETPGGATAPDIINLPKVGESDILYIDGAEYDVSITGFWRNRTKVTQFHTTERRANSADILARFTRASTPDTSAT